VTTLERPSQAIPGWGALAVVSLGAYFTVSDVAAVNIALPRIAEAMPGGPGIEWVITGYLLALGTAMTAAGWAADRFGKQQVLAWSLFGYAVATVCSALAPSRSLLVAARVLQGASSGGLAPVGQAYAYSAFPPERRAMALGVWGMVATCAPAVGPVTAGLMTTHWGWRWSFGGNVPLIVAAALLTYRKVPDDRVRDRRPFDTSGLALAALAFSGCLLGLSWMGDGLVRRWPATLGAGLVALVLFVRRSVRVAQPLLDLRGLATRTFLSSMALIWMTTVPQIAQLTMLPIQLQVLRGATPFEAALLLLPSALVMSVTMPIAGRVADRLGARLPMSIGMGLIAVGSVMLSLVDRSTPTAVLVGAVAVHGVGVGFSVMPNTVIAMRSVPIELASQAAVCRGVTRQVAAAVGAVLTVVVVSSTLGGLLPMGRTLAELDLAQSAYNRTFQVMALVASLGIAVAQLMPGRDGRFVAERAAAPAAAT
jgi:EmrB/QacA subfamily drug resistance transporter